MGADATPLIPLVVEMYKNGRLPYIVVETVIELYKNTKSIELLNAWRNRGDAGNCGPGDHCRLLELGVTDVEDDLLQYLLQHWHIAGDYWRCHIAKTLGQYGTANSLEMLEVIQYKLAGSVQEQSAAVEAEWAESTDVQDPDVVLKAFARSADAVFLDEVREAVRANRRRFSLPDQPTIPDAKTLAGPVDGSSCTGDGPVASPSAETLFKAVEMRLAGFVLTVLKQSQPNWWEECVPLTMRQECAQRQEEEKNRWPKEAYFDLIDLKDLMQKNWKLFETTSRRGL